MKKKQKDFSFICTSIGAENPMKMDKSFLVIFSKKNHFLAFFSTCHELLTPPHPRPLPPRQAARGDCVARPELGHSVHVEVLGPAQESWLFDRLATTPAIWKILAQQVPMMRLDPDDGNSPAIASEFIATSISSHGDGFETRPTAERILSRNPHIAFLNNRRGYTLHEATPARTTATFRGLDYVSRPGAPLADKGVFVAEIGDAKVRAA